jgi:hypothetical protein
MLMFKTEKTNLTQMPYPNICPSSNVLVRQKNKDRLRLILHW